MTEGVDMMTIESRRPVQDERDRKLLGSVQRAGRAPGLRYEHVIKTDEPLLWAADVIAGVVSMHVAGADSTYFTMLRGSLLHIRGVEDR